MTNRIVLFFVLFAAVLAYGQVTKQPMSPNLYKLSGGQMHITFSTSGVDGKPHFTYQDEHQTQNFTGSDVRQTKTEIGTLVSVTIRRTVDTGSTSFTVLLPDARLAGPSSSAQVHAIGITTVHKFSLVPAANQGQTELYTTTELSGTASAVVF
jgi:hypothetical protein